MPVVCLAKAFRYLVLIATTILVLLPQLTHAQCVPVSGTISGVVYADTNNDGVKSDIESGLSNVQVSVYNSEGQIIGNAISAADGTYIISDLQDGTMARLIFSYLNTYSPAVLGQDNMSSVQFHQIPQCNASLGLLASSHNCSAKSEVVATCFVQGDVNLHPNEPTIVGFEYGFNSESPVRKFAMQSQTGSIWGLAWKQRTKELYSSAFVKQYSGLTSHGHDAIFKSSEVNGMYTTSLFAKLSDLGQDVGTLTVTNVDSCSYGAQVGKIGLGALVISDDDNFIYTINIYNNTLVKIPSYKPTAENTNAYKIPDPGCTGGVFHAFALKYHNGKLYVGGTCTGELSKNQDDSQAIVYEFNPTTGDFTEIFSTNAIRGYWYDTPADGLVNSGWLTDIDFTDDGNMLLSISDRVGHRYCKASTNRLDEQKPDLLMVWNDNGVWTLEDNGQAGALTGTGVGNGQGPGGGEFFGDDYWVAKPLYHSELAIGSIYVMPGTNSVVAAVFDPEMNAYSGGMHRYNTTTGAKEGSIELYSLNTTIAFGKATGFGEIISLCGENDVQIGNLVWFDDNQNGYQDPSEKGVSDLILNLLDENCNIVGTTKTDALGNYVFDNSNVDDGLETGKSYFIQIDPKIFVENKMVINNASYNFTTYRDNDLIDNNPRIDDTCGNNLIPVNVSSVDHTFDLGLRLAGDCSLSVSQTLLNASIRENDVVDINVELVNKGAAIINGFTIQNSISKGMVMDSALNPDWEINGDVITYTSKIPLKPGDNIIIPIHITFDGTSSSNVYENVIEVVELIDATNTSIENLEVCFDDVNDFESLLRLPICDLALMHTLKSNEVYSSGSSVTFVTRVCNQGTMDAEGFDIVNYKLKELVFDPKLNELWALSADGQTIVYHEDKILTPAECRNYELTYFIDEISGSQNLVNYAEISNFTCNGDHTSSDFDSEPDLIMTNDVGGKVGTSTDDMMTDHGGLDEDDHDPLQLHVGQIELGIVKKAKSRSANAGDLVEFVITLNNLGTEPITKATIVDYVSDAFILEDPTWTFENGVATKTIEFSGDLQPGASHTSSIFCRVDPNVKHPYTIYNTVEIKQIFDQFNRDIIPDTQDDNSKDDDSNNISTSYVVLICPAEYEPCSDCRAATTPTNGQFELFLKIASAEDEEWYVESSTGLYDINSPYPPESPILLPNGYTLEEMPHEHEGHSYYILEAVHLDGKGFAITFRNKFGDVQQVNAPATTCNFEKVTVSGPLSLCIDGVATYEATSVSKNDFVWKIDDVEITGETESTLDVDWSAYPAGSHTVEVNTVNECSAPAVITVKLGAPDGASIACIGDFNVSLDGNCNMEITPQMMVAGTLNPSSPYSVMLTDVSGNVIAGNLLSAEHIGKSVMAKLIEGCGGNSCWSTITVSDKTPPVSICAPSIEIPCYFLDNYKGPFETDNCGGDVVNNLIYEQITTLSCDPELIKYIDRSYQAVDQFGNKSAICNMRINVARPDLSIIVWPEDFTMVNDNPLVCTEFEVDENNRPVVSETGVPTVAGLEMYPYLDPLCNVYTTFVDKEVRLGCVRKIAREWLVYEQHCTNNDYIRHTQYIDIVDQTIPVFEPIDDVTITVSSKGNCEAKYTLPIPNVTDVCSPIVNVTVTYPSGFIDNVESNSNINLAVGENIVTYVAYDGCQNSSAYSFNVKVEDKTAPVMICKGAVVTSINSEGDAYLYPKHIDDGTYDNCALDSLYVARMDLQTVVYQEFIHFDCADVGKTIMVGLRGKDASGNSNVCMTNVTIQDKHVPVIHCPADVTINCDEANESLDFTQFGLPTVEDSCPTEFNSDEPIFSLNSCREGEIYRTFYATDGANNTSCTQTIYVISEDRFDPYTDVEESIDFTVTDGCSVEDLKPENFNDLRGYPILHQSECGLAAASYKDEVFNFVTGACFKVLRRWTVIDWCEMNRLGSAYEPYTFEQVIKVENNIPPVFDAPIVDLEIITESGVCDYADVSLSVSASDVCTQDTKLRWSYKVDFDSDGHYDINNNGLGATSTLNGEFPVGTHRVLWSFEDGCGNVVAEDQIILVRNDDNPKASCLQEVSISLSPMDINGDGIADTEMSCLRASTLNASSFHPCGHDITFAFSHDPMDTLRCFDCFDVGLVDIDWYVIDEFGNYDICKLVVDVQDNNDSDVCEKICEENPVVADISGDDNICTGEQSVLTVTGGVKYHWSTGESVPSIIVHPTITTTYSVTVTNEVRCTAVLEYEVTVHTATTPVISGDVDICSGSSTTLTASNAMSYEWSTGQTTASIIVSPITNTNYIVTTTDVNGCTATATALVVVNPLPNVQIEGSNVICINETTTLTASGASSYLWSTGETTQSILVAPSQATTYSVTGTDSNGCINTDTHAITVNGLTINIQITGDDTVCLGSSSQLTASGGVSYVWNTGATTNVITVTPTESTTYMVTGTDSNGCTSVDAFTVNVDPLPIVAISGNMNVCLNSSTTLTASGGIQYIWNTGETTASLTVTPLVNTTYSVTATDGNGCQAATSTQVVVNALPNVLIQGSDVICINETTELTATGATSYVWSTGETTESILVSPSQTTTYSVTGTDSNGCINIDSHTVSVNGLTINIQITGDDQICLGSTSDLTASGGVSYIWSTGETSTTITVSPTQATTYSVTGTDSNGCSSIDEFTVNVDTLPVVVISGDLNICPDATTTLSASGATSYVWSTGETTASISVSPTIATTYSVTATDGNGCINNTSVQVNINTPPIVEIDGDDELCLGESSTLSATTAVTYSWSTGETTQQIVVTPSDTTTYSVTITDAEGCTNSANFEVITLPLPTVNISGEIMICIGDSDTLIVSGGASYLWNTGSTNDTLIVTPDTTTLYTVTITDANGCQNSGSFEVIVDPGVLTCSTQNITVFLDQNGAVTINPEDVSTGSVGACADFTADVVPGQFFCNQIGAQIVTLTVTNTATSSSLSCTAVVTVLDTIPPTLVCPLDLTLDCDDYDPNTSMSDYGSAFFDDNCPNGIGINESSIVDVNSCGIGQISRTFVVTDVSGNSVSCVQLITFSNPDPLVIGDITFPPDVTVTNCESVDTSALGVPTISTNASPCSDIEISFIDDFPSGVLCGGTYTRIWTIEDNCNELIGGGVLTFTHTQTITVTNLTPGITGPSDTTLVIDATIDCDFASLDGVFHAATGCNLVLSNDFNTNNSFDVSGEYPIGTTVVTLTAFNPCTNSSVDFVFTVNVVDNNVPDIACIKIFPHINDNLEALEPVTDHVSITNSCANIVASYSNVNINDTLTITNCSDVGVVRQVFIYFWYEGASAPFYTCTSAAQTQDPNGYCTTLIPRISGHVVTESGIMVPEVHVDLKGSSLGEQMTSLDGAYAFEDMELGESYSVVPTRDNKDLEGVSTLDIIYIQRHIVGSAILNSPYKIIAADVNNDKKVSVADISELRKTLLGIFANYPNNTSWRMVDQHYNFPDVSDPFVGVFDERCNIDRLDQSMSVDFTGVKVGDVNSSYNPAAAPVVYSRSKALQLYAVALDDHTFAIKLDQDALVSGLQFAIDLPNNGAYRILPMSLPLDERFYHINNGVLKISFSSMENIELHKGDVLFEIIVANADTQNGALTLDTSMDAEYYDADLNTYPVQLHSKLKDQSFAYNGTYPNPWNEKTNIMVTSPSSGNVQLVLKDVSGKAALVRDFSVQIGENTLEIQKSDLPHRGLYIGELHFGDAILTFKMLNIE
ncbi:MAG: SdrD B-like domain-containing protein [Saprospiraceae bacterium]